MATGYPDYQGQKYGLLTAAEWAAHEGTDKNLSGLASNKTFGQTLVVEYEVPAGKTLYLHGVSFFIYAFVAANYDHFFYALVNVMDGATVVGRLGGLGGGSLIFPKPIPISAGTTLGIQVLNGANVAAVLGLSAGGYEV